MTIDKRVEEITECMWAYLKKKGYKCETLAEPVSTFKPIKTISVYDKYGCDACKGYKAFCEGYKPINYTKK